MLNQKIYKMKITKIAYWSSTSLIALLMLYSVYAYLMVPAVDQVFKHLGYPSYFRIELAIAKLIGAFVLIFPFSLRIKEWAYSGFTIVFISAFIAHTIAGDPAVARIFPIISLALLMVSYISINRLQRQEPGIEKNVSTTY